MTRHAMPRGICADCGRSVAVRQDGRAVAHYSHLVRDPAGVGQLHRGRPDWHVDRPTRSEYHVIERLLESRRIVYQAFSAERHARFELQARHRALALFLRDDVRRDPAWLRVTDAIKARALELLQPFLEEDDTEVWPDDDDPRDRDHKMERDR